MDLKGRQVLVTGAAAGIGLECALAFAKHGANLVISDINEAALEEARARVASLGARCLARVCDVASDSSVAAFASAVHEAAGPLDVLVNNAGVAFLGSFDETPLTEWQRIYDINVLGIVRCTNAFLPAMRQAGGERKIVNVASAAGFTPLPNMSAYAASKHAVVGLSEVLAMELHETEVSVLVVCPGIINTAIVHVSATTPGISAAQIGRIQKYYADEGCHPSVVAEDIVRAVERDQGILFTGPGARAGYTAMRISRGMARRFTLDVARKSGYLA
ncbi:MAG TPA: SDR family NAD(P)-dependent oxidoreductase [Steroidobacteraceae bacterium]|nr:SDR family NAD(P)-dependent oxidoreductase [Steroidobacteraceae bacterium]